MSYADVQPDLAVAADTVKSVESSGTPGSTPWLLPRLVAQPQKYSYAVLCRDGGETVEVYRGDVVDVDRIRDIPLPDRPGAAGSVLAMLPFRQVRELGFSSHDDQAPLRCLIVRESETITLAAALEILPKGSFSVQASGFDVSDADYAASVARVISDEIGRGEGANFVIRRDYHAHTPEHPANAALILLRRLLTQEVGAYWSFAVHMGDRTMVGATPERHVSVNDGLVLMNPISGTYRYPPAGPGHADLMQFLADNKETEELFMVVDEELKMMCHVCAEGGQVLGPYLKPMSALAHTEYLLRGRSDHDVRDILRHTMFAPTVTGSPVGNATRVITRYETTGRGYYAGVLALLTRDRHKMQDRNPDSPGYSSSIGSPDRVNLDAPILIRTAHITPDGTITVPVGATLVRHSVPEHEVAETHAKAAGVLRALGIDSRHTSTTAPIAAVATSLAHPIVAADDSLNIDAAESINQGSPATAAGTATGAQLGRQLAQDPEVLAALDRRNHTLSAFWLQPQRDIHAAGLAGRTVVIVDAEDAWTEMLSHLLRRLGMVTTVTSWTSSIDAAGPDLLVAGPGPGDPRNDHEPRMIALRDIMTRRLDSQRPLLAVCLSHQILAHQLGLPVRSLTQPYQGTQREVDIFGHQVTLGYYNAFSAFVAGTTETTATASEPHTRQIDVAADPRTGEIHALRGPGFTSVQAHLESLLSKHGLQILTQLLADLFNSARNLE